MIFVLGCISWSNKKCFNVLVHRANMKTFFVLVQGGSNMTGTDLCVNKPHCAAAVRP